MEDARRLRRLSVRLVSLGLAGTCLWKERERTFRAFELTADGTKRWFDDSVNRIGRIGNWLIGREERDPLLRNVKPWKKVNTDQIPFLAEQDDLKIPKTVPTLVLELDGVIAHLDYHKRLGWRVTKRPYADTFLKKVATRYEVIMWSRIKFPVVQNLLSQWDVPIMGLLHAENCTMIQKQYYKNLARLGRDLKRVIALEPTDTAHLTMQPKNVVTIERWNPVDTEDKQLQAAAHYLMRMSTCKGDVRREMSVIGREVWKWNGWFGMFR